METLTGQPGDSVKSDEASKPENALKLIVDNAFKFHFHQLLERLLEVKGQTQAVRRPHWLKMRPSDWLSFPASDVRRVNLLPNDNIDVEVTFGGFYGVDAPLPQYFLEDVTRQDEKGKRIQAFLDVFNNQAYWLRHLGWRKFRLLHEPGVNNLFQRLAAAQTGTYHRRLRARIATPGALVNRCRSAAGIENLLRDLLVLPELEVDDKAVSLVTVDEQLTLDGQQALGSDTFLGQQMPVLGRKVNIHTGEVNSEKGQALQPEGLLGQQLGELLQHYLPASVGFDVQITLPASERPPSRLGEGQLRLGQAMVLGDKAPEAFRLTFSKDQYQRALTQQGDLPQGKAA